MALRLHFAVSADDYKLISSIEDVRAQLKGPSYRDRLQKPLAYWTTQEDRRLPLAFLGRTVGEIVEMPVDELFSTPGVGHKKIRSLVRLLHRVALDGPQSDPLAGDGGPEDPSGEIAEDQLAAHCTEGVNAGAVTELLWRRWQATVRRYHLEHLTLGRVAGSLKNMPTVIWKRRLGEYIDYSLAELRGMRGHGEKRIRCVLEAFGHVDRILGDGTKPPHLDVQISHRFIGPIDAWMCEIEEQRAAPTTEALREGLVRPLVEQTREDAGDDVYELTAAKLGVFGTTISVRDQSLRLGVTRARVYQLLETNRKVMAVRWPEGKRRFHCLAALLSLRLTKPATLKLFEATREMFFPVREDQETPIDKALD